MMKFPRLCRAENTPVQATPLDQSRNARGRSRVSQFCKAVSKLFCCFAKKNGNAENSAINNPFSQASQNSTTSNQHNKSTFATKAPQELYSMQNEPLKRESRTTARTSEIVSALHNGANNPSQIYQLALDASENHVYHSASHSEWQDNFMLGCREAINALCPGLYKQIQQSGFPIEAREKSDMGDTRSMETMKATVKYLAEAYDKTSGSVEVKQAAVERAFKQIKDLKGTPAAHVDKVKLEILEHVSHMEDIKTYDMSSMLKAMSARQQEWEPQHVAMLNKCFGASAFNFTLDSKIRAQLQQQPEKSISDILKGFLP